MFNIDKIDPWCHSRTPIYAISMLTLSKIPLISDQLGTKDEKENLMLFFLKIAGVVYNVTAYMDFHPGTKMIK